MTSDIADRREGNPAGRERASALLQRYPLLASDELGELLAFYNTSPAIDTALLTCEDALQPKISLFLSEQQKGLRHTQRLVALKWVLLISIALTLYALVAGSI